MTQGIEGTLQIPLGDTLTWSNHATWMIESKNRDTGNPLSLIPRYTLNSMLDWQLTPSLSSQPSLTGLNVGYTLSEHLRLGAGVSNLFDKRLFRKGNASAAGAALYNQHGRGISPVVITLFCNTSNADVSASAQV